MAVAALTRSPRRKARSYREPEGLASGFIFLFAVRAFGWAIAVSFVLYGARPDANTKHEPLLLILTGLWIVAGVLYVPLVRPRLRRLWDAGWQHPRADLLALAAVDIALGLWILYVSGGFLSPYYHYAALSLLIPSFLLNWRGAFLLMSGYLVAFVAVLASAGQGSDLWLDRAEDSVVEYVLTLVVVILVSQYLSWLGRRLEARRQEAERVLEETSALYQVAAAVAAASEEKELVGSVAALVAATGRFRTISVWHQDAHGDAELLASFGPDQAARRGRDPSEAEQRDP